MSLTAVFAVLAAGLLAGAMNVIVGSGSLVTFPTLLAVGFAPVLANVSNTVGLVPGALSGATAYRRELRGQRGRALRLGCASVLGGLSGASLLLALPGVIFRRAVPVLIVIACLLMAAQPRIGRWLGKRGERPAHGGLPLLASVFATGVYGGYFGAAQGVILISLLAIFIDDDLQRLNGVKNVLTTLANGTAALLFVVLSHVSWEAVGLIAAGSSVGGQIGGVVGRRLSPGTLRVIVVIGGVVVASILFVKYW
ncbi:MAG: sulfite exporter TauE/SafE family protein [Acidimicrobiales bacterium]